MGRWKQRWGVVTKLSPAADCLHLQLYRDSKDRYKQGHTKASLSLQHFLGLETGFTLDKESNTIAILCEDVVVVLAFDSRERLMQWQVKLTTHLGDGPQFLVLVSQSPPKARVTPGPARFHVQEQGFCISTGVPPRLAGHWLISHLRRYGVVEGRFCFEGGSRCGRGEGLHVLLTDQAEEITNTLKLAAQGLLQATRRRPVSRNMSVNESPRRTVLRPETRVSELSELSDAQQNSRAPSPYTDLDSNYGCGDTVSVCDHEGWGGPTPSLERCMSCISKLGAMSRSSTATVTPGAPPSFSSWETACCHQDRASVFSHSSGSTEGSVQSVWHATKAPARPPKPNPLSPPSGSPSRKPPMPLPELRTYDNYDIPKMPFLVEPKGDEHYDTPKRIKECLAESGTLRKPCGCVLRLPPEPEMRPCPCQRVGCWPGSWALPYCRRGAGIENTQPSCSTKTNGDAIYATVDMSKKSNRRDATDSKCVCVQPNARSSMIGSNYMNLDICGNPAAGGGNNYANIDFAQSLEYYENAKQLLQKAGITEAEIACMENETATTPTNGVKMCHKCGHASAKPDANGCKEAEPPAKQDDYLMMEPARAGGSNLPVEVPSNTKHPGYLPMSPAGATTITTCNNADLLKQRINKLMNEKSASNPNLGPVVDRSGKPSGSAMMHSSVNSPYLRRHLMDSTDSLELKNSMLMRKRSSSADSTRILSGYEDDSSRTDSPSSETIRQSSQCCCKTVEKCTTDAQIAVRRSSSVPCKSNRDSSSSNDSGVFELPRHAAQAQYQLATLPRRSKSSDPLKDLSFQFQKTPGKSSSAEAEVPICPLNSGSTSSGTSDMSDYIETLSLSSHSSSDAPQPTNTLRPRSGNEYLSLQLLERPRQIATVPEERFQSQ